MFREKISSEAARTTEGQKQIQQYEEKRQVVMPLIEQTARFQAGMKYRFCPEIWRPNKEIIKAMRVAGNSIGEELIQNGLQIPEFRIDFVKPKGRKPQVLEIDASQDRGLPEIAILENAYLGEPKTPAAFCEAVRSVKPVAELLTVVYPDEDKFYYTPYEDFGRFCRIAGSSLEVWPVSINQVVDEKGSFEVWKQEGKVTRTPDVVIDYTSRLSKNNIFFDTVGKDLIADLYQKQLPGIPPTFIGTDLPRDISENRQRWIVKPVDQQWGQGIELGRETNNDQWQRALAAVKRSKAVVQKFYPSEVFHFPVMQRKNGKVYYQQEAFNLRIEGYYFLTPNNYQMQGAMVTGLPVKEGNIVHGKRSCIMVPAEL